MSKLYKKLHTYYGPLVGYYYRSGPVPGIHRLPGGHYFRRIRTTNERRLSFIYPELIRKKRNFKNIPNSWDDYQISSRNDRSWKNCTRRKRQWK